MRPMALSRRDPGRRLACLAGLPQQAQPSKDPDWPCIQRKVPELSLGQIWNGPELPAAAKDWSKDKDIAALVQELAARRVPIAEAQKEIREFAASLPADQRKAAWRCWSRACSTT